MGNRTDPGDADPEDDLHDDDDEDDDEEDARNLARVQGDDLTSLEEWLNDWAILHDSTLQEALDGAAAGLPRQKREQIEDARGTMAQAVAVVQEALDDLRDAHRERLELLGIDDEPVAAPKVRGAWL
jgi:hypothetical protein